MSQVLLDFNLSSDLFLDARLDDFGFVETFECKDIFWLSLGADHVYAPELALSKWSAYVEIGEVPLAGGGISTMGINYCGAMSDRKRTNRETLESRASSSAASPYTFSPLVSFSISNPPSYLPISIEGCVGAAWLLGAGVLVGEGGRVACLVGMEEADAVLVRDVVVNGFGAANFVNNLLTFPAFWLGFFWRVGAEREVFCLEDISSAAIWRVTAPIEVMLKECVCLARYG